MNNTIKIFIITSFLLWIGLASAVAEQLPAPNNPTAATTTPPDVLESVNRVVFNFNLVFANYVVIPTAGILSQIVPDWLKQVGSNVYENVTEPEFMFTNLVSGHPKESAISVARLAVNSTVGIAGIFDVATAIGLERRQIEISESFCNAGIPPGPYMVFPFIGQTNVLSGGLMAVLLATEWYLLSFIDEMVAAGDAILDTTVGAASLRHINDVPKQDKDDLYTRQQNEYWNELKNECPAAFANNSASIATFKKD